LWNELLFHLRDKEAHALEIGSYEGRSAVWFLQNVLNHPESTLTCVDPWEDEATHMTFNHNISFVGASDKVKEIKSKSDDTRLDEREWDFVYIDGWHSAAAVMMDAARSWTSLKKGGIMIWDDYLWKVGEKGPAGSTSRDARWRFDRPQLGVTCFIALLSDQMSVIHKGYQVAVKKL
jgi:predicted O-methyltransferase YrrM